jgi:hypothetical protein
VGSAFSFKVKLAEVCFINTFTMPLIVGRILAICDVIKWNPLEKGASVISF